MRWLGIERGGVNAENGQKLLLSFAFVAIVVLGRRLLRGMIGRALRRTDHLSIQTRFWTRQAVSLLSAVVLILGLPARCRFEPRCSASSR